jgi:hypothetical protein
MLLGRKMLRGKWSKRILLTLLASEECVPLRELGIRCGVTSWHKQKSLDQVVARLLRSGHIFSVVVSLSCAHCQIMWLSIQRSSVP